MTRLSRLHHKSSTTQQRLFEVADVRVFYDHARGLAGTDSSRSYFPVKYHSTGAPQTFYTTTVEQITGLYSMLPARTVHTTIIIVNRDIFSGCRVSLSVMSFYLTYVVPIFWVATTLCFAPNTQHPRPRCWRRDVGSRAGLNRLY